MSCLFAKRVVGDKTNVTFDTANDDRFLSYQLDRSMQFVAELSNGTLNDSVRVLNIPAVVHEHFCASFSVNKGAKNNVVCDL